jgi:hypothetical protein
MADVDRDIGIGFVLTTKTPSGSKLRTSDLDDQVPPQALQRPPRRAQFTGIDVTRRAIFDSGQHANICPASASESNSAYERSFR